MTGRAVSVALLALAASGCTSTAVPGSQVMGTYMLHAVPVEVDCALPDVPIVLPVDAGVDGGVGDGGVIDAGYTGIFDFQATFSRDPVSGQAWVTLQGNSREGAWTGQVFTSSAEARRVFPIRCGGCLTSLEERMVLALISHAQSEAAGNRCPPNPLDGGVTVDPDAGVGPPQDGPLGFDAVRACGELATRVLSAGLVDGGACAPECSACAVRYLVTGERR